MTDDIPSPRLRDLPPGHLQARKQHLLDEIARPPQTPLRALPISLLWERRGLRPIAVVALAVAATVVLLGVFGGSGSPGAPSSAAAGVFKRLAGRIAEQSWTPGPDQYLYLDTESEWGAIAPSPTGPSCETRSVERNQTWVGADGSGLNRETKQQGTFTSPADREVCLSRAGDKAGQAAFEQSLAPRSSDEWYAPNCMGYGQKTDWSRFSSDPQTLLQQIDEQLWRNPGATPAEEFDYIEQTLGQQNPPPDVVANIYRAAALIPGVQSLGTVQDHAGRSGLGLSFPIPGGITEMIFDPQTGKLLGQTDTGRYGGWSVYLHKEVVDQIPADPPVPLTPACAVTGGGVSHDIPGGSVMTGGS